MFKRTRTVTRLLFRRTRNDGSQFTERRQVTKINYSASSINRTNNGLHASGRDRFFEQWPSPGTVSASARSQTLRSPAWFANNSVMENIHQQETTVQPSALRWGWLTVCGFSHRLFALRHVTLSVSVPFSSNPWRCLSSQLMIQFVPGVAHSASALSGAETSLLWTWHWSLLYSWTVSLQTENGLPVPRHLVRQTRGKINLFSSSCQQQQPLRVYPGTGRIGGLLLIHRGAQGRRPYPTYYFPARPPTHPTPTGPTPCVWTDRPTEWDEFDFLPVFIWSTSTLSLSFSLYHWNFCHIYRTPVFPRLHRQVAGELVSVLPSQLNFDGWFVQGRWRRAGSPPTPCLQPTVNRYVTADDLNNDTVDII